MKQHLFSVQQWFGICIALALFLASASFTHAMGAPSVTLTVNNGASAAILNGQPVELDWYAVDVTNCVINNGVGPIPNDELPSGGRTVIPPDNLQTVYTMTCEIVGGGSASDTSTVSAPPVVNFSSPQGDVQETDPLTGTLALVLNWDSQYATECSNITWEQASGSTGSASNANDKFEDQYKTSGELRFDKYPNYPITETTTYKITCSNQSTGLSTTVEYTVTVTNAPPAPDPTVNLTSTEVTINASPTLGFGYATLDLSTTNITWCEYTAFDLQGTPISVNGFTNRWGGNGHNESFSVEMSTSTRFVADCKRDTDSKTASSTVTVVLNQLAVALPAPTLSFSVTPANVTLDPLSGEAEVIFSYTATNVNNCPIRNAIEPDGNTEEFHHWGGATSKSGTFNISTTTVFVIECKRNYDGATVRATTTVTAEPSTIALPPPYVDVWVTDTNLVPITTAELVNGFARVKVWWYSDDSEFCNVRRATLPNGASYTFSPVDDAGEHYLYLDIATTTTFYVECGRGGDTLTGQDSHTVTILGAAATSSVVSDGAIVYTGECIDENGVSIDTPAGYMPDPVDGSCVLIPPPSTVDLDATISGVLVDEDSDAVVTIGAGDTIDLSWSSTDAYECLSSSGEGFNVGGLTSGSDTVTEPSIGNAIVYTIQCRGYGGNSSDSLEIRRPATAAIIEVSKTTVNVGETVDINWNLNGNNPGSCVLTGPAIPGAVDGELALAAQTGSFTGLAISGESNFTVTCEANNIVNGLPVNDASTDTATVRIIGQAFDS